MKRLWILFLPVVLFAYDINSFMDLGNCDKIIDKTVYKACYSYSKRSSLAVWYKLTYEMIRGNMHKRESFYSEKLIPKRFRTTAGNYINSGYDRGHMASDASFDCNSTSRHLVYSMVNIVPQLPYINRIVWKYYEMQERKFAKKYKTIWIYNIIAYGNRKIKNKISIPIEFRKIIVDKDRKKILAEFVVSQ